MNVGAFGVLIALGRRGEPNDRLDDLAGVGFRHPLLALCMTVFLLSLAGVPPMAGFIGKFYLFSAVIDAGHTGLALIARREQRDLGLLLPRAGRADVPRRRGGRAGGAARRGRGCWPASPWRWSARSFLGIFPGGPMQLAVASFESLR